MTRLELCLDALDAVGLGDEARLGRFIVEHLRLVDASTWLPHVAEALWRAGRNGSLRRVQNPLAYVRALARRIEYVTCRESLFGRHAVWDGSRRRHLGTVIISRYSAQVINLTPDRIELPGHIPAPDDPPAHPPTVRLARAGHYREDTEEFLLAAAMDHGVPRRSMAGYLGWSATQVERVWKRIYRAEKTRARQQ